MGHVMATLHPNRVVALYLRSGTASSLQGRASFRQPTLPNYPYSIYGIPIFISAEKPENGKDTGAWSGPVATFHDYRSHGAPICFTTCALAGPSFEDSSRLAVPFFDACFAMRMPDKGSSDQSLGFVDLSDAWLAPFAGTRAVPIADYKDDPHAAVWLPTPAAAKAWMDCVSEPTGTR